jgi:hypothetical protein
VIRKKLDTTEFTEYRGIRNPIPYTSTAIPKYFERQVFFLDYFGGQRKLN